MADVFISYSRRDGQFVGRLEQALRAQGKDVWVDREDIGPGTEWRREIDIGLTGAQGVVFVMSPDSLASPECAKELDQAVERGKRIVPVLHREPNGVPVPDSLAKWNWVALRDGDDFDLGVTNLIRALEQDAEWVHEHTRLGSRATEWEAAGRNRAYLLRGADLTEAESFLTGAAGKDPEPTALQLEYVAASRAGARRFLQLLLSAATVALLVAVTLAVLALIETNHAHIAQQKAFSRQLAADAEVQLSADPELSVLLAARAYDVSPTAESVSVLRQAIATSKLRAAVRPADGVSQAFVSSDEKTLTTVARGGGEVRVWQLPGGAPEGVVRGVEVREGQASANPADGRLLVADRRSGQALVLRGLDVQLHLGSGVTSVAWGDGGRVIAAGGSNGTAELFNGTTGRSLGSDQHSAEPLTRIVLSADGRRLAAAESSGRVVLYDLARRRLFHLEFNCPGGHTQLLFSPDGSRLFAYGGSGCGAQLWNTSRHRPVGNVASYASSINDAAFSPDGQYLGLAGEIVALLNPATGTLTDSRYLGHQGFVKALAFAGGAASDAVSAGVDGAIHIWNPANPTATLATLRANGGPASSVGFTPRGNAIVSVDADGGAARVWATDHLPAAATLPTPASFPPNPGGPVLSDGRALVGDPAAGNEMAAQGLRVVSAAAGAAGVQLRGSANLPATEDSAFAIPAGFFDGGGMAYGIAADGVHVWRTGDGSQTTVIPPPSRAAGTRTPDLAAASGAPVLAIRWKLPGVGLELASLTGSQPSLHAVAAPTGTFALSPDGTRLALAAEGRLTLRSARTGAAISSAPLPPGRSVAPLVQFTSDGNRLLVASGPMLQVASVPQLAAPLRTFTVPAGSSITAIAATPSGRLVAEGSSDFTARLWAVAGGGQRAAVQETQQPDQAGTGIAAVGISPDGQFLLTSVGNEDTQIWQVPASTSLLSVPYSYAGWEPGLNILLTATGVVYRCEVCVAPGDLRRLAARRVTRGLTPGERATYLTQ